MADVRSFNKVILMGYVCNDPDVRKVMSVQTKLARFKLATHEKFKDKKEHKEFHSVVAWGVYAEFCEKYLKKGDRVHIEGKLRNRYWNDEGKKIRVTDVRADSIILLDKKIDKKEEIKEKRKESPF